MSRIFVTGGSGFIGTHLVQSLFEQGHQVLNFDLNPPKLKNQSGFWAEGNILDADRLGREMQQFSSEFVVHLAARASTQGRTLDDYLDNTVGTANLLASIKATASVRRVIITSSQHVRKPGSGLPANDEDFAPHGLYGESKVITEKLTRKSELSCEWVIIRPTTVWGPWHPYLPGELWAHMKRGWYFHPKNDPVVRSYGYVRNVVWQIEQILLAPSRKIDRKVFYTADCLMRQIDWVDAFSQKIANRPVRQVPVQILKLLSIFGDKVSYLSIPFPMNSPRFFNLTTTNPVPLEATITAFGRPPVPFNVGLDETLQWLNKYGYKK